jgi:hypothetical protein
MPNKGLFYGYLMPVFTIFLLVILLSIAAFTFWYHPQDEVVIYPLDSTEAPLQMPDQKAAPSAPPHCPVVEADELAQAQQAWVEQEYTA